MPRYEASRITSINHWKRTSGRRERRSRREHAACRPRGRADRPSASAGGASAGAASDAGADAQPGGGRGRRVHLVPGHGGAGRDRPLTGAVHPAHRVPRHLGRRPPGGRSGAEAATGAVHLGGAGRGARGWGRLPRDPPRASSAGRGHAGPGGGVRRYALAPRRGHLDRGRGPGHVYVRGRAVFGGGGQYRQLPRHRRPRRGERDRAAGLADRRLQRVLLVMTIVSRILAGAAPLAPKALVRPFAMRYIAGPALDDALATIRRLSAAGRTATVDVLGEQLSGRDQIEALMGEYRRALDAFAGAGLKATLSVKMTGIGLSVDESLCAENVRSLVAAAGERPLTIELDMEDSTTTRATVELYRSLRSEGFDNIVIALQAYMRRSLDDLQSLRELEPRVRLVKGIWVEPPQLVFGDPDVVRGNYMRLLEQLLSAGGFAAIASHDEWIHWRSLELIEQLDVAA